MPPHQNREKKRKYGLRPRALVYDTSMGGCTIKIDDKIRENYADYWAFQLGPPGRRADSWDLFLNEKADRATAAQSGPPSTDDVFIAGLRLGQLGVWGRLLRKTGVLSNGYIVKPQIYRTTGSS